MKIPRDFDRWMFDYKEGNLSQSEISYFEKHISENPQLNSDIDAWDNSYIKKESIIYPAINSLQKGREIHFGWASTIAVLVISTLASLFFITNQSSETYSLRNSELKSFSVLDKTHDMLYKANQSNKIIINTASNNALANVTSAKFSINNNSQSNLTSLIENNNSKTENNYYVFNNASNVKILNDELNKIESNNDQNSDYSARYNNNPNYIPSNSSAGSIKNKSNYGSIGYKIKKVFRKIEKISGYPVGLTNLKDPDLLIPNSSLLDFNGGFVGGYGSERFELRYRNQWLGQSNNLQSAQFNFDTYSKSLRGGLGLTFNSENFNNGAYTDNRVSFFYSPKFRVTSKVYFEPFIKMTLGLMTIDNNKVTPNTKIEIGRGRLISSFPASDISLANNLWYKDYGIGFLINTDKFYVGANANNISKHSQSIYGKNVKAPIEYSAIAGIDYQSRNKKMTLSPFVSYYNNTSVNELWAGINVRYQSITIGGAYSSKNDYSASIGMKFKTFKMIYQYDMTNSYLSDAKFGSHTIGIRINTKKNKIR